MGLYYGSMKSTPIIFRGNGSGKPIKNQDIVITDNGVYTFDEGFTGLGTVTVNIGDVLLDKEIKNIKLIEQPFTSLYLINTSLSGIPEEIINDKPLEGVDMLTYTPTYNGLIYTLTSNSEYIINGFGSNWFIEYEDKPMDVNVKSGSFSNFETNDVVSFEEDTYKMYNINNEFGINGCLINYEDDGSEKTLNAYLMKDIYEDECINFTTSGNIIENERVFSGFNQTSYFKVNNEFNPSDKPWEMVLKITTGNSFKSSEYWFGSENGDNGLLLVIVSDQLGWYLSSNGSSWNISNGDRSHTLSTNTTYLVRASYDLTTYKLEVSADNGQTWSTSTTINSTSRISPCYLFGGASWDKSSYAFQGSIDLNASYIKIGDEMWWQPYETKTLSKTQVCLIDGEMNGGILAQTDFDSYYFIKEVTVPEHDTYTPTIVDVPIKVEDRSGFNGTIYCESSDRLAYNLTNMNYVAPATEFTIGDTGFEIMTKIKFTDISSRQKFTGSSIGVDSRVPGLQINSGGIGYQIPNTSGRWQVDNYNSSYKPSFGSFEVNQWYWIKFTCSDTYVYTISASKDGEIFDTFVTYQGSKCYPFTQNDFCFGNDLYGSGSLPSNAFIDLTGCYIKINDEYVWNGATDNYRLGNGAGVIEDNETKISYTNWSSSNNISVPTIDYTKPFELSLSFRLNSLDNQPIFDNSIISGSDTGLFIGVYTNKLYLSMGSGSDFDIINTGVMDVAINKWYTVKLVWDTTKYVLQNLTDAGEWEDVYTINNSTPIISPSNETYIGYTPRLSHWRFGGYINYSDTYYKQEDNVWGVYVNKVIKELQFTKN